MSRDKQIEEMAKDIEQSGMLDSYSRCEVVAEELHAKGYRKASEVALEVLVELEAKINQMKPHKVYNDKSSGNSSNLGREHALWDVIDMIHEIAEKYTEDTE